jgi:hypothetical protein
LIKADTLRACLAQLQLQEFLEMVIPSSSLLNIMTGSSPAYSVKKILAPETLGTGALGTLKVFS